MTKYVVIIEKSAGNDSVGDMWKETKIFDGSTPIRDVMMWAMGYDGVSQIVSFNESQSRINVTLTKPHPEDKPK